MLSCHSSAICSGQARISENQGWGHCRARYVDRSISPAKLRATASTEIGLAKAIVMVSRLNLFWGLRWTASLEFLSEQSKIGDFDVVLGCVDTRAARIVIGKHVLGWRSRVAYWLELGNLADSGQFVLGQPLNSRNRRSADRLRTAPEIFPELCDESLEAGDGPSCSGSEALDRQGRRQPPAIDCSVWSNTVGNDNYPLASCNLGILYCLGLRKQVAISQVDVLESFGKDVPKGLIEKLKLRISEIRE